MHCAGEKGRVGGRDGERDVTVGWLGNQAREGALTSKDAKDVFRCLSRIVQVSGDWKKEGIEREGGGGRGRGRCVDGYGRQGCV